MQLINDERQRQGLNPLQVHSSLVQAARVHSKDMVCNNFFSHTGSDGSQPWDRARRYGYPSGAIGENLFMGSGPYNSPQAAFQGWMNSPGHRQNMLDPRWVHIGIGYALDPATGAGYFTAVFGQP